jgi:hypothetical protein
MNAVPDLFDYAQQVSDDLPVERGVPIPTNRVSTQRVNWDALRGMLRLERLAIGDSIAIKPESAPLVDQIRIQNFLSGAACSYRKAQPPGSWAFTTRQMPDGSVRLWRIPPAEAKGRGES